MVTIIEWAREEDYEALISLFQEFATFEMRLDAMTNTVGKMKNDKDIFKCFVVKGDNNEILGYATFYFAYYTWSGRSLQMDDLYVRKEYRGAGVGTKLINRVISYAMEQKCGKLRWQVSNWNEHAIRFYESLGATINRVDMNCDLEL